MTHDSRVPPRRHKICFIIPSLAGGGAERVAVTVLSALDAARYERTLYLFSADGVYFDRIAPGIHVVTAARRSWLGRLYELTRFLRAARPDVVMPFLSYFITVVAARLAGGGARVVFNQGTPTTAFLGDPDFAWRRPWRRRLFAVLTRVLYPRADAVVVTSKGVADDLTANFGVPPSRIRLLHNPVDVGAISAAAAEPIEPSHAAVWRPPVIVAAGRLAEVKNYALLIEALAIVRERVPAMLAILGQGEQEAALRSLVAGRGLEANVFFCGFHQNPWRYIARADVFALTSRYEGFGNVLVEAMACGVPVVATSSDGTRDIVEDGVNGLLVSEHTPEAVAAALVRVLADPAERARLARAARPSVARFDLDVVAAQYEGVLREVMA